MAEIRELIEFNIGQATDRLVEDGAQRNTLPNVATLETFYQILSEVVNKQLEIDGDARVLQLVEEFPEIDDNIDGELILYSLHDRRPMAIKGDVAHERAASGRAMDRQRRSRLVEKYPDPDAPDMTVAVYMKGFDNVVLLQPHALTNKTANRRALWLEETIEKWRWYFQAKGIPKVEFLWREADKHMAPENRKYVCRPMYFFVRTHQTYKVREFDLLELTGTAYKAEG